MSKYDKGMDDAYFGISPRIDDLEYLRGYGYAESLYEDEERAKQQRKEHEKQMWKDYEDQYYNDLMDDMLNVGCR